MNRHYAYLYDDFLSDKTYERALANVETRCSVLGIQGRVARLAIFRSARELVESLVRDGAETIVLVGNDKTVEKAMWFLPDLPITVGYLPICAPSAIGTLLGIPMGDEACDVLAARRVETVDVGKLDDRYFLTEVSIEATKAMVDIEGKYRVSPHGGGAIYIRNLGYTNEKGRSNADARDGWLDAVIIPAGAGSGKPRLPFLRREEVQEETHVLLRNGAIFSNEPIDIMVDGHTMNGFTFRLGIVPKKLRLITGRDKRLVPIEQDLSKTLNVGTFSPAIERVRTKE
jgi:diacylglycerol kinase family enzyme